MPSDSTLTATIAYEGSKRAQISDLTVELIPLTVALNGTAITSYTVTVTDYWGQPSTFAAPDAAGSARGVLVGPGTAYELGTGTWRVWVHYDGDPEDITRVADGWIEVAGASIEVSAALSVVSQYQLRAERGQPGGYATLGNDGIVDPDQLPVTAGGSDPLKQDADADLTAIAGLTPTNDDVLQRKSGAWTNRTPAQLKTDLSLSKSDVGLGSVDNTADTAKPVSTAAQTALDGKQPIDSDLTSIASLAPTNDDLVQRKAGAWTNRTPAQVKTDLSLTKSDVGLGSVDNTADASKPVSTAQQTALNLKAPLDSPALTGTPTAPTAAGGTNTTQVATTAFVTTAVSGGSSGARKDVQVFTATGAGTWNCPSWAVATSMTQTELIGGGGGGGSGRRNAAGNARGGGSAGAGAAHSVVTHKTLTLAAAGGTLAVNVGAGGAGGAGVAASTVSDGNAGTAGGASWVGTASYAALVYAGGGAGGVAGSTGAGATAVAGSGSFVGGSGAAGSATAAGVTSNTSANAATGGGGGGAVDSSNVAYAGGSAGAVIGINPTLSSGGVVGGAAPTTNTSATVGDPQVGTGGGGGAGSTTACGQAGADGGRYGGAGGGAGGGLNSASAGFAGGAGANGIIVMTTWE